MEDKLKGLVLDLFDRGSVRTDGPFKFKLHEKNPDAPRSPLYLNLRLPPKGVLTEELVEQIGNALYQVSCENQIQYDCVVGVPKAGDPFAKAFSRLTPVPQLFLEKDETEKGRIILPVLRGEYRKGWRVLIIDDVVVMADSKFEVIEAIRANGLIAEDVVVLVDWEHGGKNDLEKAGFRIISVFKMSDLLLLYLKERRISQEKYQEVMAYLKAIRAYFGKV